MIVPDCGANALGHFPGVQHADDNVCLASEHSGESRISREPATHANALAGDSSAVTSDRAAAVGIEYDAPARNRPAQQPHPDDFKAQFLHLCDLACTELNRKDYSPFLEAERYVARPKTHHVPFFEDSHAVRALAVAYDMTGNREYLDTCRRWSDRMIAYQDKMIPQGAYYLNYYRQPGDAKDQWFSSDAASVGMAVLATAVRCGEKAHRERYLDSVRAFAKLVADKYVKDGGITDGLWTFDGPWWASTAICGEMFLLLYEETGDEQYRKIGAAAAHWLLKTDFRDSKPITMKERPSGIVFYDFGFYAVALKYLPADSPQRKSFLAQISEVLNWLEANQIGRGGKPAWAYDDDGHTDMAGLPFLMYSFAGQLPEHRGLTCGGRPGIAVHRRPDSEQGQSAARAGEGLGVGVLGYDVLRRET